MKRLIIYVMVLVLFLIGLSIIGEHVSWASEFTFDGLSYLSEDPNEPEPEGGFIDGQILYLSEDPNEDEGEDNSPE